MLYIHPPLAIFGYVFIFLFTITLIILKRRERTHRLLGTTAWLLTFLGLITGMIWAQNAWGSYWSWDPKEILTLLLFASISVSIVSFYEKKIKHSIRFAIISCLLSIITFSSSFLINSLHSIT